MQHYGTEEPDRYSASTGAGPPPGGAPNHHRYHEVRDDQGAAASGQKPFGLQEFVTRGPLNAFVVGPPLVLDGFVMGDVLAARKAKASWGSLRSQGVSHAGVNRASTWSRVTS